MKKNSLVNTGSSLQSIKKNSGPKQDFLFEEVE
jgi:hypothetical protein